jgi:hypothetical protein
MPEAKTKLESKIAPLCISIETVKVSFFLSGVEVLQVPGVEVSLFLLRPVVSGLGTKRDTSTLNDIILLFPYTTCSMFVNL